MAILDPTVGRTLPPPALPPSGRDAGPRMGREREEARRKANVGGAERIASLAAGSILAALGIHRRSLPGLLGAGVGAALLWRGATGRCPLYRTLGVDTARERGEEVDEVARRGIHTAQAFLIGKPREELYRFWRNLENLPRIMTHLLSVKAIDDRRSHWVAKAPWIAGGTVEWEAEVVADEPGARIAWRSLPGSEVENRGEVRFVTAPGDRGTEVHVSLAYAPPAHRLGHWIAAISGHAPGRLIREDLRNFKRMMETGEVPTIIGQPHGTCTGVGERYSE